MTKRHVYKTPDDRYVIHASVMFDDQVMIMALDDALAMKNFCTQRPGLHDCTLDDIQPTLSKALEKVCHCQIYCPFYLPTTFELWKERSNSMDIVRLSSSTYGAFKMPMIHCS